MTFALADLEEDRKNISDCHALYDNLLNLLAPDIDELKNIVSAEVDVARGPEIIAPSIDNNGDIEMNGRSEISKLVEEREARGQMVAERRGKDVDEMATAMGVIWVMYMRFARRAEVSTISSGDLEAL